MKILYIGYPYKYLKNVPQFFKFPQTRDVSKTKNGLDTTWLKENCIKREKQNLKKAIHRFQDIY